MPARRRRLADVFAAAAASRPQAFDLPTRISLATAPTIGTSRARTSSRRVKGSDPALQAEHVVYIAHVDHFGRGVAMNGDDIYNGAHDNASGVGGGAGGRARHDDAADAAAALGAVPVRDRRGAGASRLRLLRSSPDGATRLARGRPRARHAVPYHPLLDIVPYGAQHSTLLAPVTKAAQHLGHRDGRRIPSPSRCCSSAATISASCARACRRCSSRADSRPATRRLDGAKINAAYRRDVYHKPNDDMSQAVQLRGRRAARAHQLPDRVARGAGDRAPGLESGRFLRSVVRKRGNGNALKHEAEHQCERAGISSSIHECSSPRAANATLATWRSARRSDFSLAIARMP